MDIKNQLQKANQLLQNNDIQASKRIYLEINRISPCLESIYSLGLIYGMESDYVKAEKQFKQSLKYNDTSDVIWNNLGIAQMHQGKSAESIKSLKRSISFNPDNNNAKNSLGNLHQNLGDTRSAEKLYLDAYHKDSDNHVTLNNLASIYIEKCEYTKATPLLNRAILINPGYISSHYNLGSIHQSLGDYQAAITCYKRAEAIDPAATKPKTAMASCYELMGEYENALKYLEPLIDKPIPEADTALTYGKVCHRMNRYDDGIKIINNSLKNKSLTALEKQELHYSIADLYDKKSEYGMAYQHYKSANNIQKNKIKQDNIFSSIENYYKTPENKQQPCSNNESDRPIFILGMPRSGTSLIEQILSSHSKVYGAGELPHIIDISNEISNITRKPYPEYFDEINISQLNSFSEKYLSIIEHDSSGYQYCTDKMPHNFLYIGLIKSLFRNCKIIHCIRNPMDVCLSIYFHNFNSNHPYSNSLGDLGNYYNNYREIMSLWKEKYCDDIFNIEYESLIDNPESEIRSLLDYIGLEWEDSCLYFYKNKRIVSTPSYHQVNKPLYKTSSNRWKNYSDYIAPLKKAIDEKYFL